MKNSKTVAKPVPKMQIQINVMSNGDINVQGFPTHLYTALKIMDQARNTVISYFIDKAKNGKLNEKNVVDDGLIVVPHPSIIKQV